MIGSPNLTECTKYLPGGGDQRNPAHYAEFVAGLAALDFFKRDAIQPNDRKVLYADSITAAGEQGVGWPTLPLVDANRRDELRRKLWVFTTALYFYKHFLYPAIMDGTIHKARFYREKFRDLQLKSDEAKDLYDFAQYYLDGFVGTGDSADEGHSPQYGWLNTVSSSIEKDAVEGKDRLFAPKAFEAHAGSAADFLHSVITPPAPARIHMYSALMDQLNGADVPPSGQPSGCGRLMYLLNRAATNAYDRYCAPSA